MKNLIKPIIYPEYRKQYQGFCSGCGKKFPLVEMKPAPEVRDAIRKFVEGGELDFTGKDIDACYCPECFAARFGSKGGQR